MKAIGAKVRIKLFTYFVNHLLLYAYLCDSLVAFRLVSDVLVLFVLSSSESDELL